MNDLGLKLRWYYDVLLSKSNLASISIVMLLIWLLGQMLWVKPELDHQSVQIEYTKYQLEKLKAKIDRKRVVLSPLTVNLSAKSGIDNPILWVSSLLTEHKLNAVSLTQQPVNVTELEIKLQVEATASAMVGIIENLQQNYPSLVLTQLSIKQNTPQTKPMFDLVWITTNLKNG